MTLILTQLTPYGIAMAADTALSVEYDYSGETLKWVYTGARKLQEIPRLDAGISWWGEGLIDDVFTDLWLEHFIRHSSAESLEQFALSLRDEIRSREKFRIPEESHPSHLDVAQ